MNNSDVKFTIGEESATLPDLAVKKEAAYQRLWKRVELLSRGMLAPTYRGATLNLMLQEFKSAGPEGKGFQIRYPGSEGFRGAISVPIYSESSPLAHYALKSHVDEKSKHVMVENGVELKGSPLPKYLNTTASNGTRVAGMHTFVSTHSYKTLTLLMDSRCRHVENDAMCRFCKINHVSESGFTITSESQISEMVELIKTAQKSDGVRSLTITTGSFAESDDVVRAYINLVKAIKTETGISIHIQHEPVKQLSLLKETAKYCDTVGIFLEIFDNDVRKRICPGKSMNSVADYVRNWQTAVEWYGRGKVMTTCLLGFDEDYSSVLEQLEQYAQMGVKTALLFTRAHGDYLKSLVPSHVLRSVNDNVDLFVQASQALHRNGIPFSDRKDGGCVGCCGCTAMFEACEYAGYA